MNTPSNRLHARCLVALFALAAPGLAMAQEPVRRTPGAEAFRAALDMAPPTAVSVVVVPNPKMAADDLAECMARLDQAAGALPLRPLDLLKSRFGIGPGIDDTRAFVMWHEVDPDQTAHPQVPAMLVPVTDAKAFLEGNFKPVEGVRSAWTNDSMGTVYARTIDRHVLISQSAGIVNAYGLKPGFAASLKRRLGDRGYEVFTSGDAGAWAGLEAMKSMRETAAQMQGGADRPARAAPARGNADAQAPAQPSAPPSADPVQRADLDGSGTIDNGDLSMLMLEMGNRGNLPVDLNGDGVVDETDANLMRSYQGRTVASAVPADAPVEAPAATPAPATPTERANQIADGVTDGVFAIDMDPLGMSVRTYAVMDPRSEIGQSARGGTRGAPAQLTRLPKGAFVVAGAADMQGLGGADAFIDLLKLVPGAPEMPTWVRENRNLLTGMQFAIYPSKLGLAGGGLLNEAMLWMSSTDSAKASTLLRDWMQGLAGIEGTTERKVTWEAGKALKDGATADAYAITESTVTEKPAADGAEAPKRKARAANPMQRLARMLVFGPRGPMGFAKTFPDGMLVTFSQRPDVLARGIKVAEGGESLQQDAVITALRGWLTPDPDVVAYVGIGSLLNVVRQAASSFPGAGVELPDAPPGIEPIALSLEVQNGRVETATMVPTAVMGVFVELYKLQTRPPMDADDAGADEPAPKPKRGAARNGAAAKPAATP
jgi:hypothetical protein